MIEIVKGKKHLTVSAGAFKSVYQDNGWSPITGLQPFVAQQISMDDLKSGESNQAPETGNSPEGITEPPVDITQEPSQAPVEEDKEPSTDDAEVLKSMSLDELKQCASLVGLSMDDLKTKADYIKAIQEKQS